MTCVSREEGFGFTPLEAAAHGTPSIVADLPVFDETFGDAAVRVPVGDPGALAAALLKLEQDRGSGTSSPRTRRRRSERLSWERTARETRAALLEAAGVSRFAIVTVIHDSEPELAGLLESVGRLADPRPRVIVVDSGSSDGGATLAAERGAEVVTLDGNLGFGAGCNAGIELVTEPVTAFVNPDVELLDDGLARLAERRARRAVRCSRRGS